MKNIYPYILFFFAFSLPTFAQQTDKGKLNYVFLSNDERNTATHLLSLSSQNQSLAKQVFETYYYLLLKFQETPDAQHTLRITKSGIELLDFVQDKTYWAKVPVSLKMEALKEMGIEASYVLDSRAKISSNLLEVNFLFQKIEVDVLVASGIETSKLKTQLSALDIELLHFYKKFDLARVRLNPEQINTLAEIPFVSWVEKSEPSVELLSNPARENFRTGMLETVHGLTGKGVMIGVWDGGFAGPHIDYSGRATLVQPTNLGSTGRHATHVVGIMAGAGLRDPNGRGVATEANMVVYDIANAPPYENYIPFEMFKAIEASDIVLTQNSYGGAPVCSTGANYRIDTRSLDMLAYMYPYLTHHYSIGNSRLSCQSVFPANAGYFSTAAGLNSAKNSITVGGIQNDNALFATGVSNSTSWGPFRDGRIAPTVVALGRDVYSPDPYHSYQAAGWTGTSFSSPSVSGVSALLYQRFKQLNGGNNPSSALMRALISNGADDLGNPNPDYQYGFGKLNALKSLKMLNQAHYLSGNVAQGSTQTYAAQINIPTNARRLKVMLSWTDPPALPTDGITLVNNLNLQLTHDLSATTFAPWVLNPAIPSAVAVRGTDNLNNLEQVTIDNPTAGTYTIEITGANINFPAGGTQDFTVVWLVEPEYVEVTYPAGNEKLNPNTVVNIQWDAEGIAGNTFDLEFFDGVAWSPITTALTIGAGLPNMYGWTVPSLITDQAKIRVSGTRNSGGVTTDESDFSFTIMGVPVGLTPPIITATAGNNQITLNWQTVSGADSYDIYKIRQFDIASGEAQYTFVGNVVAPDTSYISKGLINGASYFHTVVARTNTGVTSERAYATNLIVPTGAGANLDLQPTALISPTPSICADNLQVVVKIKNIGLTAIPLGTVVPLTYQIDASPTINENLVLPADLLVNQEIDYTFTSLANFSVQKKYDFVIAVNLPTDEVKDNNLIKQTIQRNPDLLPLSIEVSPSNPFCGTVTLTAKNFPIDNYALGSIPFVPEDMTGATDVTLGDDDFIKLPIGFNFTFWDKTYSDFFINSNGFIGFDRFDHDFVTAVKRPIPNTLTPNNFIAICWTDLDASAAGTIRYKLSGVIPNRKLVVEFLSVPYYSALPPAPQRVSAQIVLYEGTNTIELQSTDIQNDGFRSALMGIENSGGTKGVFVAGRNDNYWTTANEGLRFTPTNTSMLWTGGQTTPVITTSLSGNYSFNISQNTCIYSANTTISSTCEITKPQILTLVPADNSLGFLPSANLVITFDKQVRAGVGNVTIMGGALPIVIPIMGGATGTVNFNGNTMTINPTADLNSNTAYYVVIDNGAVRDFATPPNAFDGIVLPTTWNFNTINNAPALDNSAIFVFSTTNQNDTNPLGDVIGNLVNSKISDTDLNSIKGIAILNADNANGNWQFSLNNGMTWTNIGSVSTSFALLLPDNALIRFIPNANYVGNPTFSFRAWDRTSGTVGGTADISLPANFGGSTAFSQNFGNASLKVNARPTISTINDQNVNQDASITINLTISDLDNPIDALLVNATATNTALVSNANLVITGTGANRSLQITPQPNQFGITTINVTVSDGNATVSISFVLTVNFVNKPPVLVNFIKNVTSIGRIDFSLSDFASAYSDLNNNALAKIKIISLPNKGSLLFDNVLVSVPNLEITASDLSKLSYIPFVTALGADAFAWNASDGTDYALAPAQVNINIALGNVPPIIRDFSKQVIRNQVFNFEDADFQTAFSDADGNTLTRIKINKLPINGSLLLQDVPVVQGQEILTIHLVKLSYQPKPDYLGADDFSWNASDGFVYANADAIVNLTVITGNKPPLLSNVQKQSIENQVVFFSRTEFQNAFNDLDNNTLQKIQILSLPNKGILYWAKNPASIQQEILVTDLDMLMYVPTKDFYGTDVFSWNAFDGDDFAVNPAEVNLNILPQIPTAPQQLVAQPSSEAVRLTWEANPESNIAYYEIYMFSANTPQRLIGTSISNSLTVSNLKNGITYSFRIKAVSSSGFSSDFSATVQARPSVILFDTNDSKNNVLKMYPNPTSKDVIIEIVLVKPAFIHFSLTDVLGKVIEKGNTQKPQTHFNASIDLIKLAQGIYFLQIDAGALKEVRKIIKE